MRYGPVVQRPVSSSRRSTSSIGSRRASSTPVGISPISTTGISCSKTSASGRSAECTRLNRRSGSEGVLPSRRSASGTASSVVPFGVMRRPYRENWPMPLVVPNATRQLISVAHTTAMGIVSGPPRYARNNRYGHRPLTTPHGPNRLKGCHGWSFAALSPWRTRSRPML
jgi:hypothetical protein